MIKIRQQFHVNRKTLARLIPTVLRGDRKIPNAFERGFSADFPVVESRYIPGGKVPAETLQTKLPEPPDACKVWL